METATPWFPSWGLKFENSAISITDLVNKFLKNRPNNRWLLITKDAAASERHLWSTWYKMEKNFLEHTALSKNPDAEFIRIISGTHQLKTAFSRAGLNENDTQAWLIYLPQSQENIDSLPKTSMTEFAESAQKLIYLIEATLITERPKPSKKGLARLGIEFKGNDDSINDNLFISHLARSSLTS
tara:strand:- start:42 stop:593 length:552 start_codon:yes stop_codon:yes gene_type:complete